MTSTFTARPMVLAAMFGVVASIAFAAGMHSERTWQIPNEEHQLMRVATRANLFNGVIDSVDRAYFASRQYEQLMAVKSLADVEEMRKGARFMALNELSLIENYVNKLPKEQAEGLRWIQEPRIAEIKKRLELQP